MESVRVAASVYLGASGRVRLMVELCEGDLIATTWKLGVVVLRYCRQFRAMADNRSAALDALLESSDCET
jgi:hypothetical protein